MMSQLGTEPLIVAGAYTQYFTGQSYLNPLTDAGGVQFVDNVTFEPDCRNNWHIHRAEEGGDQVLGQKRRKFEMELRERAVKAYQDMKGGNAFSLEEGERELGLA
ncbi:hypothetical protein [uncultured Adlercreutzia sp.]|uniref:hypothetical protein n=2 Tax=uncultured Adlercreutzia sp. TaxID=875803 RepID=UPI0025E8EC5C|nr:hypothetical protein [uncultured Adlercreutzia sp.]